MFFVLVEARDIWKKKYFEEKKRTAPREEHCANLKQEMEGVNRKIIGQMETTKDTGKRDREQKEKVGRFLDILYNSFYSLDM